MTTEQKANLFVDVYINETFDTPPRGEVLAELVSDITAGYIAGYRQASNEATAREPFWVVFEGPGTMSDLLIEGWYVAAVDDGMALMCPPVEKFWKKDQAEAPTDRCAEEDNVQSV